jgi:hypothetical protein
MFTRSLSFVAALSLLPAVALADPIPQQTLNQHRDACVAKCESSEATASCLQVCDCITQNISENWTLEDFQMRHDRVSANSQDPQVNQEYREMGQRCMSHKKSWGDES